MKNLIFLLVILIATSSCGEDVIMDEFIDAKAPEEMFCKETVTAYTVSAGVFGYEVLHVTTPVGDVEPYDRVITWDFGELVYTSEVVCKAYDEWDNYEDQCFHYDNQWHKCDYCLPYPVPNDIDLEAYGAGKNCLRK